jgi:hypothetical protein
MFVMVKFLHKNSYDHSKKQEHMYVKEPLVKFSFNDSDNAG